MERKFILSLVLYCKYEVRIKDSIVLLSLQNYSFFSKAGVRLRYPSSYVTVTGETEAELSKFRQFNSGPGGTPTDSTDTPHKHSSSASASNAPTNGDTNNPQLSFVGNKVMSSIVIEKTWQDCTVASGILNNRFVLYEYKEFRLERIL